MRSILMIFGLLLAALSVLMLVPVLAVSGNSVPLASAAGVTAFMAGVLYFGNRGGEIDINHRQAFILTTGAWLLLSVFASLPFMFSGMAMTNAVFETISGITTTGSTVLTGLDTLPHSILLWRSLLQWIGGIGIIVTSIALLPFLQVGGMQLFRMESSDKSEKELPRAAKLAGATVWIYAALTSACVTAYRIGGMTLFDAVNHAMTTVSTGGYSTHDSSMGFYQSPLIHWSAVVFMFAGGIPFVLYIRAIKRRPLIGIQARTLMVFLAIVIAGLTTWLAATSELSGLESLPLAAFNVVSIVTTTGYATTDYTLWGPFAVVLFFFLTFVGGCTGSTSGGFKIMRLIVAYKVVRSQIAHMVAPHAVTVEHYEGKALSDDVKSSVGFFFFVFMSSFVVLAILLEMTGLDFVTSLSAAATSIANVGPGLGKTIGPAGNFAPLPDISKWLLCFGMILGRLEFATVLVLFTAAYWRS